MKKRRRSVVLLMCVLVLSACSREPARNTNLAASVFDVIVQADEREAFFCAFMLKDAEFNDTANNGTVTMEIRDREGVIFSLTWAATEERFRYLEVTKGERSEQRLVYGVDRFEYSRFSREPIGDIGLVIIVFDNGTSVMKGYGHLLFEHH